jgi:uncharacterized protein YbbC (DUF1343 family)
MSTADRANHVLTGLDQLNERAWSEFKGQRLALLCHPASVDRRFEHITQSCARYGMQVVRCFGPEHGIWADAQDMIGVDDIQVEPVTGAAVTSLYGHDLESLTPSPQDFEGVDRLIVDLQDIGSRYYTYIYTATLAMKAAGEMGIPTVVLDRPNPISGDVVEGEFTGLDYLSFVGLWPLPTRHGLTLGEVLRYLNLREGFNAELTVIKVKGWNTALYGDEYDYPWVQPSPNMPTIDTTVVYPGMCLFEGTNVSEGRGTTKPFELIGAQYVEPFEWAQDLNAIELGGIYFRPVYFQPTFHKFGGQSIGGVALEITDRNAFEPLRVGLHMLGSLSRLYGSQFQWRTDAYEFVKDRLAIDLLFGGIDARTMIDSKASPAQLDALYSTWAPVSEGFHDRVGDALLYERTR